MTAIVTDKFRLASARAFKESVVNDSSTTNLYMFIGRSLTWADEQNPPLPLNTQREEFLAFNEMLSLKKIKETDVVYVAPRYDWTSGETYSAYNADDEDLSTKNFYVLNTTTNKVYKCLRTPKHPSTGLAQPSTNIPNLDAPGSFTTADGYTWTYIFTVLPEDANLFLTPDWIPVRSNSSVQSYTTTHPGMIECVSVDDSGDGVMNGYYGNIDTNGYDSVGKTIVLRKLENSDSWTTSIDADNTAFAGGTVYVVDGSGKGEYRTVASFDAVTATITFSGSAFTTPLSDVDTVISVGPTISINGNGSLAVCYPVVSSTYRKLTSVEILNPGEDYTIATANIAGSGSAGASISAHVSPFMGHGYDAVKDLFAHFVMCKAELMFEDDTDIIRNNEYRTVGLIRNVKNPLTGDILTSETLAAMKTLNMSGTPSEFSADEIIIQDSTGAQGKVIEQGIGGNIIRYIQDDSTGYTAFNTGTIHNSGSTKVGTVDAIPDFDGLEFRPFDGDIIYVEHHRAINRNPDQTEDLRVVVTF